MPSFFIYNLIYEWCCSKSSRHKSQLLISVSIDTLNLSDEKLKLFFILCTIFYYFYLQTPYFGVENIMIIIKDFFFFIIFYFVSRFKMNDRTITIELRYCFPILLKIIFHNVETAIKNRLCHIARYLLETHFCLEIFVFQIASTDLL